MNVHDSVDVPEPPVTVVGVRVQPELSAVSATYPLNPFSGEMVTVVSPGELTTADTEVGLADIVKS